VAAMASLLCLLPPGGPSYIAASGVDGRSRGAGAGSAGWQQDQKQWISFEMC
jgi:hypothetical protein